ncbi:MAG: winged helix DNA-binding protein [Armatimonadetes bacterium]|nr:winged helix DNA-binding protein [Armatimonadota bacterium]
MPPEQIGARVATIYELQSAWLEPRLRKIGVSWTTFQLLTTVASAGKRASQVEVARRIGVTAATLSETVYNHVKSGLLQQVPSERDRRVKILQLTEESKAMMRQIKRQIGEVEVLMTHGLSERQSSELASLLDKVLANLEQEMVD